MRDAAFVKACSLIERFRKQAGQTCFTTVARTAAKFAAGSGSIPTRRGAKNERRLSH